MRAAAIDVRLSWAETLVPTRRLATYRFDAAAVRAIRRLATSFAERARSANASAVDVRLSLVESRVVAHHVGIGSEDELWNAGAGSGTKYYREGQSPRMAE
jgi:hypothetical protein